MKTTWVTKTVLPVLLLAAFLFLLFAPAAEAQHLTLQLPDPARRVLNSLTVCQDGCNGYTPFTAITNDPGLFQASSTESAFAAAYSITNICFQDSTITATATSLSVTGRVEISCSDALFELSSALWDGVESLVVVGFVIDSPFTYSLQATTEFNPNFYESGAIAMTGLSDQGNGSTALPNLVAYGRIAIAGADQTAPSASGTNAGILYAGTYYFQARVHSSSYVDPNHPTAMEHFLAAFNFTATYAPQPPVITAFTPDGAGAFNLTWDARQPGNYRVLSSANLADWIEYIPSASRPFGANTNLVNRLPGSAAGFFRVQYLP